MRDLSGKCLCGDVAFKAAGRVNRVSACYCSMCRAQNGGGAFYSTEISGDISFTKSAALVWYQASPKAERGFCKSCGSSLFWRLNADPSSLDISLGALDDTSGLTLDAHIFSDNCAAYQTLPADAPHVSEAAALRKYAKEN